jgi:hypothetical protein
MGCASGTSRSHITKRAHCMACAVNLTVYWTTGGGRKSEHVVDALSMDREAKWVVKMVRTAHLCR